MSNGAYASHPLKQIIAPMGADHAFNMDTAMQVKKLVNIPVILVNRISDPKMADTLLKMGKADFIAMGRQSVADPHMPNKAKAGKFDEINYYIGCVQGCCVGEMSCLVNPRVTREEEDIYKLGIGINLLDRNYNRSGLGHSLIYDI